MSSTAVAHPAGRSEAMLAALGVGAVLVASTALAVLQSYWRGFLDGFGLEGWRTAVVALILGVVDAVVLLAVLLGLAWAVGRLTRAPRDPGVRTLLVVVTALLAAVSIELVACTAELVAAGGVGEWLVTDPARWTGDERLGGLSLSNLAVYAVTGLGSMRVLGWNLARAALLVAAIAALATGASVVA